MGIDSLESMWHGDYEGLESDCVFSCNQFQDLIPKMLFNGDGFFSKFQVFNTIIFAGFPSENRSRRYLAKATKAVFFWGYNIFSLRLPMWMVKFGKLGMVHDWGYHGLSHYNPIYGFVLWLMIRIQMEDSHH